ncbi:MAG: electron transfer flavoprotein subunit beta, partial [Pseudomonadota bacterium]
MTLTVAVLVSEGRHPVSGRVRRADCDARALELALCLPYTELLVIHAGAERSPALPSYLGMGPGEATVIPLKEGADPTAPLTELLTARRPDL